MRILANHKPELAGVAVGIGIVLSIQAIGRMLLWLLG